MKFFGFLVLQGFLKRGIVIFILDHVQSRLYTLKEAKIRKALENTWVGSAWISTVQCAAHNKAQPPPLSRSQHLLLCPKGRLLPSLCCENFYKILKILIPQPSVPTDASLSLRNSTGSSERGRAKTHFCHRIASTLSWFRNNVWIPFSRMKLPNNPRSFHCIVTPSVCWSPRPLCPLSSCGLITSHWPEYQGGQMVCDPSPGFPSDPGSCVKPHCSMMPRSPLPHTGIMTRGMPTLARHQPLVLTLARLSGVTL